MSVGDAISAHIRESIEQPIERFFKRCTTCCFNTNNAKEPDTCALRSVTFDFIPECPIIYLQPAGTNANRTGADALGAFAAKKVRGSRAARSPHNAKHCGNLFTR
jgi:hypothetical protein